MRVTQIMISILAAASLANPQQKASIGDFTKSPTENIIDQINEPLIVRSVRGTVVEKQGFHEPLPHVLVEIQGPNLSKKIRKRTTDKNGEFDIGHVPSGTYRFKATLDGFRSIMGTIIVSAKASKSDQIKLEMRLGV